MLSKATGSCEALLKNELRGGVWQEKEAKENDKRMN